MSGLTELFSKSIGLEEPWYIRSVESQGAEVHIYVDIRNGNMLPCPECGKLCTRAGYEKAERVWRHGDIMFYPCYVHCRRPRVRCGEHKTKVVEALWARKSSRFTMMFEGYAMLIMTDMPIAKASKLLKCNEKSLVSILHHWVGKAVAQDYLGNVSSIAIDETSFKKGQSYVTVVIDAQTRRVIDVEQGRSEETVIAFSHKLEQKGGDCNQIAFATSDMARAYRSGIQFCFPNAKHIIDKFHIKKLMIDAMDEVRKSEQSAQRSKQLHLGRRTLMIPEAKLNEDQKNRVLQISKQYPKTGRAYRMVQAIDVVYASANLHEASARLDSLYRWMRRSRLEPMKRAATTLRNFKTEILNIFISRLTNAISEGINSMIQASKRKARGYHTFVGFSSMIYLIAAKLDLACPNPLRFWE